MIRTIGYCHGIENYSRHHVRPPARRSAAHAARLRAAGLPALRRRIAPDHSAGHGHVSRRPLAQADAGGLRLPHALGARQSPAHLRGVRASHQSGRLRLRHAGAVRADALGRRRRRAGHSPHGPGGSRRSRCGPSKARWTICSRRFACARDKNERVLVTTLTKRMSEDLAEYFAEVGVRCRYLHSEIETLERVRILRDLRRGEFDVLIGINLLREGLDLPEVSLVAILDADKEGYLRSATALIQTIGRCARHINGRAILYADVMTGSMRQAIDETNRRRAKQLAYNAEQRHHAAEHHQARGHAARRASSKPTTSPFPSTIRARKNHQRRGVAARSIAPAGNADARGRQEVRIRARRCAARSHPRPAAARTRRPLRRPGLDQRGERATGFAGSAASLTGRRGRSRARERPRPLRRRRRLQRPAPPPSPKPSAPDDFAKREERDNECWKVETYVCAEVLPQTVAPSEALGMASSGASTTSGRYAAFVWRSTRAAFT